MTKTIKIEVPDHFDKRTTYEALEHSSCTLWLDSDTFGEKELERFKKETDFFRKKTLEELKNEQDD